MGGPGGLGGINPLVCPAQWAPGLPGEGAIHGGSPRLGVGRRPPGTAAPPCPEALAPPLSSCQVTVFLSPGVCHLY